MSKRSGEARGLIDLKFIVHLVRFWRNQSSLSYVSLHHLAFLYALVQTLNDFRQFLMMCWTFLDNVTQQHQLQNDKTPSSKLSKHYLPATVDQKLSDRDKISFCVTVCLPDHRSSCSLRLTEDIFFDHLWHELVFIYVNHIFLIFMGLDVDKFGIKV